MVSLQLGVLENRGGKYILVTYEHGDLVQLDATENSARYGNSRHKDTPVLEMSYNPAENFLTVDAYRTKLSILLSDLEAESRIDIVSRNGK